jgi:uncharacterized protein (UPF0335 family)
MSAPGGHVRSLFERWQRLEEQKAEIADDLKELFAEAKGNGFNTKALRIAFRDEVADGDAKAKAKRDSLDGDVALYRAALHGTPVATQARVPRSAKKSEDRKPEAVEQAEGGVAPAEAPANGDAAAPLGSAADAIPSTHSEDRQPPPGPHSLGSEAVDPLRPGGADAPGTIHRLYPDPGDPPGMCERRPDRMVAA